VPRCNCLNQTHISSHHQSAWHTFSSKYETDQAGIILVGLDSIFYPPAFNFCTVFSTILTRLFGTFLSTKSVQRAKYGDLMGLIEQNQRPRARFSQYDEALGIDRTLHSFCIYEGVLISETIEVIIFLLNNFIVNEAYLCGSLKLCIPYI
jgi:hypothetical protein